MRWERLFADLGGEMDEAERAERAGEVAERSRAETGRVALADRLRASVGATVRLWVRAGTAWGGRIEAVGPDWILLAPSDTEQLLVALAAVESATGLVRQARLPDGGVVAARLDLRHALRQLVRDRAFVQVVCVSTRVVTGTPLRVGADFVEVAEHGPGERMPPAPGRLVMIDSVVAVRRRS